jgi:hypothetical protein
MVVRKWGMAGVSITVTLPSLDFAAASAGVRSAGLHKLLSLIFRFAGFTRETALLLPLSVLACATLMTMSPYHPYRSPQPLLWLAEDVQRFANPQTNHATAKGSKFFDFKISKACPTLVLHMRKLGNYKIQWRIPIKRCGVFRLAQRVRNYPFPLGNGGLFRKRP